MTTSQKADLAWATLGDGCRIAYRFDGPADRPVLLLSNSLGTDHRMWAPQLAAFTSLFRVLRYDSRGHGASDAPPGGYSLDRLGRDVLELLEQLSLERVHFCGLSQGGMVGQWLGYRAPERIDRLVLANTSPFMGPPANWQRRIDTVLQQGMGAIVEGSLERWFTPGFLERSPEPVQRIRAMLLACNPVGYAGCCAAIRDMDLRPTASLLSLPALIIAGSEDPSTSFADAAALAQAMANSPRVVSLPAAHLSNVEQPDAFARAVLDFLH